MKSVMGEPFAGGVAASIETWGGVGKKGKRGGNVNGEGSEKKGFFYRRLQREKDSLFNEGRGN